MRVLQINNIKPCIVLMVPTMIPANLDSVCHRNSPWHGNALVIPNVLEVGAVGAASINLITVKTGWVEKDTISRIHFYTEIEVQCSAQPITSIPVKFL